MTENTTPEAEAERSKSAARNAAEKRLRDAHKDEFQGYMKEEHEARGLEYKPRLSKEERARAEIERLAKEHGIALAFKVETGEDAQANVDILQANNEDREVPEGTPTIDLDADRRQRAAQARAAVSSNSSAY